MVVSDILSEVEVVHKLENKSKWMRPGGINANEWHNILARELAARQCFITKPL
jgi:hypothetical protein